MAAGGSLKRCADAVGVSIGCGLFGLGLGLLGWSRHAFRLTDDRGIVSWVTVNRYPIHQETVALLLGVACVAIGVWLGQATWARLSRALSGRGGLAGPPARRLAAFSLTAFASAGASILSGAWTPWSLIAVPVALAAGTLGLGYAARDLGPVRSLLEREAPRLPTSDAVAATTRRSAAHRVFTRVVVPVCLYVLLYDTSGIFMAPIDPLHEGERLAHITQMRHGGLPYRDFYVQHGLGQDVLKAWLADTVLDGTVAGQRLVERALRPLGGVALYLFGLALFRSPWTAVLLVLTLTAGRMDVHDRLVLGLLAVGALATGLRAAGPGDDSPTRAPSWRWSAGAGLLAALAFWYSTEIGLYAAAACGGTLSAVALLGGGPSRERAFSWFALVAGGVLGLLPVLVVLVAQGALDDFVRNSWIQVSHQRIVWGLPFPSWVEALDRLGAPTSVLELGRSRAFRFYVPIAIVLSAVGTLCHWAVRGRLMRGQDRVVVLLVTLYAFFLIYTALGRSDNRHVMYASAPAYALLLLGFESAVRRAVGALRVSALGPRRWLRAIAVTLVVGLFCAWWTDLHDPVGTQFDRVRGLVAGRAWPRADRPRVWAPLGAMGGSPGQIAHLRRVVRFIEEKTEPGEPIFDFTNQAVYYFLADRPSASRYVYVAYAATPELEREVIAELEADRTRLVLYRGGPSSDDLDGVPIARRHPTLDRYLRDRYASAVRIDGTVILTRR